MNLRTSFIVAAAAAMAASSSLAFAQEAPPFQVRGVAAAGSGCPAGTVSALASTGDGTQALTILFDSFTAEGQSAASGRARGEMKTCQIALNLVPQQGFQIALLNIETRGSVDVFGKQDTARGINNTARITREYFFNDANSGYRFPLLDTYLVNSSSNYTIREDTIGLVTYAACNATVITRARVGLMTTGANNYADISSIDQNASVKFSLQTRRCSPNDPRGEAQIIDITGGDDRAEVRNACALRGVGTSRQREVCYDEFGQALR